MSETEHEWLVNTAQRRADNWAAFDKPLLASSIKAVCKELETAQARALKYEQALREVERQADECPMMARDGEYLPSNPFIVAILEAARAALDKPGTEAMDEVIEYVNCPKCGGRAVSVTRKSTALDKPGTEVENSANEVENLMTEGLWKQVFNFGGP